MATARHISASSLLVLLAVALTACGSESTTTTAATTAAAASGDFPATVEHKYGTTTVEKAPKRVVVVGIPRAGRAARARRRSGGHDGVVRRGPRRAGAWARAKLGGAPLPTVLPSSDSIDVEKVAAQRPDLIIGIDTAMTQPAVRAALADRPDHRAARRHHRLRHLVAAAPADGRRRAREGARGPAAAGAGRGPDRAGRRRPSRLAGQGGGQRDDRLQGGSTSTAPRPPTRSSWPSSASPSRARCATSGRDGFGGTDLRRTGRPPRHRPDPLGLRDARRPPGDRVQAGLLEAPVHREGREVFEQESSALYDALSKTSVLSVPVALELLAPRFDAALDGDPSTSTD